VLPDLFFSVVDAEPVSWRYDVVSSLCARRPCFTVLILFVCLLVPFLRSFPVTQSYWNTMVKKITIATALALASSAAVQAECTCVDS
jgi:hypothetical protein